MSALRREMRLLGDESIIIVALPLIAGEAKRLEILHRCWSASATRYDVIDFESYGLVNFWVGSAFYTTIAISDQDGPAELGTNRLVKTTYGFVALVELRFKKLSGVNLSNQFGEPTQPSEKALIGVSPKRIVMLF